jgi:hypothetical protein
MILDNWDSLPKISADAAARTQRSRIDQIKLLLEANEIREAETQLYMLLFSRSTIITWRLACGKSSRLPYILTYIKRIEFKSKGIPTAAINLRTGLVVIGAQFFIDQVINTLDLFFILLHERNHFVLEEILRLPHPPMPHSMMGFAQDAYINAVVRSIIGSDLPERFYDPDKAISDVLVELEKNKGEPLTKEEKENAEKEFTFIAQMLTVRSDMVDEVIRKDIVALVKTVKVDKGKCDDLVNSHYGMNKDTVIGSQYFAGIKYSPPSEVHTSYGTWMRAFYEWWKTLNDEAQEQLKELLKVLSPLVRSGTDDCPNYGPKFDLEGDGGEGEGEGDNEDEDDKDEGKGNQDWDFDQLDEMGDVNQADKQEAPMREAEDTGEEDGRGWGVSRDGKYTGTPFTAILPCSFESDLISSTMDDRLEHDRPIGYAMQTFTKTNLSKLGEMCGSIVSRRAADPVIEGTSPFMPTSLSRRDLALLGCGYPPTLYRVGLGISQPQLQIYMDVSGSMHSYLPFIPFIAQVLKEYCDRFFQFSTVVVEVDGDERYYYGTGGTDYDNVAKHILLNGFKSVIIVTDETDSVRDALMSRLSHHLQELYLIATPGGWGRDRGFTRLAEEIGKKVKFDAED